jgi:hypothetical protein
MDQGGGVYGSSVGVSTVPGASVQVSRGMAFAPPSWPTAPSAGRSRAAEPGLQPERVRNDGSQLASRVLWIGRTQASGIVSLFRADIDGMILWFPIFATCGARHHDVECRGAELMRS